jgi:prophage regulatory protein
MAQKVFRRREVEKVTGLSRSTLYEEIAEGRFPKPINIGTRAVAWLETEVEAWQKARIAERDAKAGA